MAIDVHKTVLTNPLPNPASQSTTTVCRDHQHKNNQPIPAITAKNRPNANANTTKNKKKKKQASPKTRNLPKTLAEMMITPEQREALAQACAPLAKLFDANTTEYVFETFIEDSLLHDEVKREFVSGILFDRAVACEVRDRILACNNDINRSPPTNTKIQPTTTTNKTVTPPKVRPVPVISNKKTKKTKKKQKQETPPKTKTKTTHEIKQPSVNVEETQRYMLHLRNNPNFDKFPMNNKTIRTQIAECEVAYYKIRHTNPVLADVDMDFYHSLPPVQVLLGEMTRLENKAMLLDTKARDTTATTTTTVQTNVRDTNKDTIPTFEPCNNATATTTTTTTSTTASPMPNPTVDPRHHVNSTDKATTSKTETSNNNNINDNPVQADDNHISGLSNYLLEQQKAATEAERWEKERTEENIRRKPKRQRLNCEQRRVEHNRQSRQQKEQRLAAEVERWEKQRMKESESQRQLKQQRLASEKQRVKRNRQHRQREEQKQAQQQQQQEQRAQEHREDQLNRYYEEQTAAQSTKRRKATEARVRVAEEDSKARGARGEQSLETPNLIQSTPAFVKPSKESVIQAKVASQIVTNSHTKKKQPMSDDEHKDKYDVIPDRIRDTDKKNYSTRTTQGKKKQKKKVQCVTFEKSGKSRKRSKDPGKYGTDFGMQMIADRFGDGWHKSIGKSFGVQRIAALFGDGVT